MEYLLSFLKFAINSFGMKFLILIFLIIFINIIYFLLYLYFENNTKIKYKNRTLRTLFIKFKSKKYGLKTEVFEKINNIKAP